MIGLIDTHELPFDGGRRVPVVVGVRDGDRGEPLGRSELLATIRGSRLSDGEQPGLRRALLRGIGPI